MTNVMKKPFLTDAVDFALNPKLAGAAPPVIDSAQLNTGVPCAGYPHVFDPMFEESTILHNPNAPARTFIGWEKVKLRWMKPDGHGGMVPR